MKHELEQAYEEESSDGINISPLIDVVFILLLFFIVTTVFVEESGVEIQKPQSSQSQTMDKESLFIAISADQRIFYGGKEIGLSGITPTINRLNPQADRPVIIQVDGRVPTKFLIHAVDEIKAAGIESVNIATLSE